MGNLIDITGNTYGNLSVIKYIGKNNNRHSLWECLCSCGNYVIVTSNNLRRGYTKSCGCITKERVKNLNLSHNLSHEKIYGIWKSMKSRCNNDKTKHYFRYGGRGIKVCTEWNDDFKIFYDWAVNNGYSDKLTLDRIDNNGNYEPSNCRWVDMKVQSNNTRKNRLITYNGETKTLIQWCEFLNISRKMVTARLRRGWDVVKALDTPPMNK